MASSINVSHLAWALVLGWMFQGAPLTAAAQDRQVAQRTEEADTSAAADANGDRAEADADSVAAADGDGAQATKKRRPPTVLESIVQFAPFILIGLVFYFLMFRPHQKKNAETAAMLKNIKKGDRVVTVGGILGQVVNTQKDSEQVTLLIDEGSGAKIRVLRSHLARVLTDGDKRTEKDKDSDKSSDSDKTS
jgi:preprotein translocase subunit YajC